MKALKATLITAALLGIAAGLVFAIYLYPWIGLVVAAIPSAAIIGAMVYNSLP